MEPSCGLYACDKKLLLNMILKKLSQPIECKLIEDLDTVYLNVIVHI
jgi:hypothetical protein